MPYPPPYRVLTDFAGKAAAGEAFDPNALHAELGRVAATCMQLRDFMRKLATPDGKFQPAAALTSTIADRFTYTAAPAQADFLYPAPRAAVPPFVRVFVDGVLKDPAGVTIAADKVTLAPALVGGELVIVELFDSSANLGGDLASRSHAKGASLIGVEDADGILNGAPDVEMALAVLANGLAAVNSLVQALGVVGAILRDGSVPMAANLNLGGFRAVDAADAVDPDDLTTLAQVQALIASGSGGSFLPLAGGTMTGIIDHGGVRAVNAGMATSPADLVRKDQSEAYADAGDAAVTVAFSAADAGLSSAITAGDAGVTNLINQKRRETIHDSVFITALITVAEVEAFHEVDGFWYLGIDPSGSHAQDGPGTNDYHVRSVIYEPGADAFRVITEDAIADGVTNVSVVVGASFIDLSPILEARARRVGTVVYFALRLKAGTDGGAIRLASRKLLPY